jgi:hypothetical protein
MATVNVGEALDRVEAMGGTITLNGDKVSLTLPNGPESESVAEVIRQDRDAVAAMLRERAAKPPTLAEVEAALPGGAAIARYEPKKEWPLMVRECAIVTDINSFIRAYLRDLKERLENPESKIGPSAKTCLEKLHDVGLELRIDGGRP